MKNWRVHGIFVLIFLVQSGVVETQKNTLYSVSGDNTLDNYSHDFLPIHKSPWRPIQEKIKDTVVQIFAQIAEFDWLQPYRTPHQYATRGSGFFINDQGHIITNAHVVDQALGVWIQIPSLGKKPIEAQILSVCPDRDLALLAVAEEDLIYIKEKVGKVPYLPLGNSDLVYRADEVLALGYPLGQESLKSTSGVVSGREQNFIQMSAPINPGNSGGPLLNNNGEVIGINTAGITEAQNIGFAIPVNDLKIILPDFYKVKLLRKPFLGSLYMIATESLTSYLGNPIPGGCYIVDVVSGSPLSKAGILPGDMIYEINGIPLDIYGEMSLPWNEDKVSISNYVSRLAIGQNLSMVVYRKGARLEFVVTFDQSELLPIRKMYPSFESIDYEVFGGMVVMELTLNHVKLLINHAPGLARFADLKNQGEPILVVTHVFPTSLLYKTRSITPGVTLKEINGMPVKNLADFRTSLSRGFENKYFTIKSVDYFTHISDNSITVLPFDKVLQEELVLARHYHYQISDAVKNILRIASGN